MRLRIRRRAPKKWQGADLEVMANEDVKGTAKVSMCFFKRELTEMARTRPEGEPSERSKNSDCRTV